MTSEVIDVLPVAAKDVVPIDVLIETGDDR
jgi:hypothetical protein